PVALVFGWIFDVTPEGVHRTSEGDEATLAPHGMRGYAIGGVGIVAIVMLIVMGAWARYARNNTSINSIAVLPFSDLSPTPDQEYFADGIADEILDALAKVPGMKVAARTSAFQYKGKNPDVRS